MSPHAPLVPAAGYFGLNVQVRSKHPLGGSSVASGLAACLQQMMHMCKSLTWAEPLPARDQRGDSAVFEMRSVASKGSIGRREGDPMDS